MRVAVSWLVAGLSLAAAGAARAAEQGGALDQTKQELRQLQSDEKNKAGQAGDKLKLGSPGIDLHVQDNDSSRTWLNEKLKNEKKLKQQQKSNDNWLVDGVEKLQKDDDAKGAPAAVAKDGATPGSEPHTIDQSDPQYLLKLFDEQKKNNDAKNAPVRSATSAAPDPFAPFLQNWLGSSPVRGQFFDQSIRKNDGGTAGSTPAAASDYRGSANNGAPPASVMDTVVAEKTNPYLADLNAPLLTKEIVSETTQFQSMGTPLIAREPVKSGPVNTPTGPAAPEVRERQKATLPGLSDDKKYFPQLKRF